VISSGNHIGDRGLVMSVQSLGQHAGGQAAGLAHEGRGELVVVGHSPTLEAQVNREARVPSNG